MCDIIDLLTVSGIALEEIFFVLTTGPSLSIVFRLTKLDHNIALNCC